MKYATYRLLVNLGGKVRHLEIVAISKDAALADVVAAYGDVQLIQYSAL
jgi:hypothetical protein